MTKNINYFLKPTYYLPENDEPMKTNVQRISTFREKGGLSGHALAVAQAIYSIAYAIFINIPYYLLAGIINLFVNCICLRFESMVLGHYKAAMQSLIYSAIATIYVAIGVFIPPVLNGFKMQVSETSSYQSALSSRRSSTSTQSTNTGPEDFTREGPQRSSLETQKRNSTQVGSYNEGSRKSLAEDDWLVIPNVPSFAISSGLPDPLKMIGDFGINLEIHAYRNALQEYARILCDDFGMNLDTQINAMKEWLQTPSYKDNPMIRALYDTLVYLKNPVYYMDGKPIYTDAKKQYETYVDALRKVIQTEQYQKIRRESNVTVELKQCLALIGALCEARFLLENHGLLRSLLQLHEEEYDRLNPERVEIPEVTRENFSTVLMAINNKVNGAPPHMKVSQMQRTSRMFCGAMGFEDFVKVDISFLRGKQVFKNEQGEERIFYYIRHPTPHLPGSISWIILGTISRLSRLGHIESGEAIAPEFTGMLESIAERGESYLIQSHQRLNDTGKTENEKSRSQTLYRLQESHKNFHVVFQGVEGDLFDHKGSYATITTFAALKKAIKTSFYSENSPNRLPAFLEEDTHYRDVVIDRLLDQVHQTLFGWRDEISFKGQDPSQPGKPYPNREWQEFILAFYIFQGDDLKFRLPNVKYFCTNCKNFFDRGGNRAMAEDRLHQEMSEQEVTRKDLEETIVNLVPVPLQSKGKGVIAYRLPPGLALAETLAKLSFQERQSLQGVRFNGYKPDRFEVSQRPQHAIPLIEDAHTLPEMQEILKALQGKLHCVEDNAIVEKNWAFYQKEGLVHLFKQINKDLPRLDIYVDEKCYNAQVADLETKNADSMFTYLTNTGGLSEELAFKVMAQIQQGVFMEPLEGLRKAFRHAPLSLSIVDASEEKSATIRVTTTGDAIKIEAKNYLRYRTEDLESPYFRDSPIASFKTMVLITIPKDGSASNAHWTWEIVDVPV